MPPFYLLRNMWWRKKKDWEIVVLGAGRGGTSLLATLLDAHPQLEVHMEEFVPEFLVQAQRSQFPTIAHQLQAFKAANLKLARKSPLRYGNKITTEQLGFFEGFGKDLDARQLLISELWKGRKILFIVRDGRTCISSKMERTGADYPTALNYWKHSIAYLKYLQEAKLDIHLLKFEDLLREPREELQKVCDFLDLSYSESMLAGTASDRILIDYRRAGLEQERAKRSIHPAINMEDFNEEMSFLDY